MHEYSTVVSRKLDLNNSYEAERIMIHEGYIRIEFNRAMILLPDVFKFNYLISDE